VGWLRRWTRMRHVFGRLVDGHGLWRLPLLRRAVLRLLLGFLLSLVMGMLRWPRLVCDRARGGGLCNRG
jgi:hypothetical protein